MKRFFVALAALAGVTLSAQPLRVVGSDLVQPLLASLQQGGGPELALDLKGTQPGLLAFGSGSADAVVVLDTGAQRAELAGLVRYQVGSVVAVVVVHADNPIRELTLEQVRAILASPEAGGATRWGELGLEAGGWGSRTLTVRAVAPRSSLAFDFARSSAGVTGRLKQAIVYHDSSEAVFQAMAEDRSAVAIASVPPPPGSTLRAVPVSGAQGETSFGPTLENVFVRDYKLTLPVRIHVRREQAERVEPLLRALYSDAGTALVVRAGLVPLPPRERAAILGEF
jgi:ABC-type phosphate transport system substrate-binding protein